MVEIVAQKPKTFSPAWRWPLWIALALLFLALVFFAALRIYLARIGSDILSLDNQIKAEAAKVSEEDAKALVRLSEALVALNNIIKNHSYFSEVLGLINSITYPRVAFSKFDASSEKNIIQVRGTAQNYTALAKQMVALRDNKYIGAVEVKGISFGANGVEFELVMGVDPKVFTITK